MISTTIRTRIYKIIEGNNLILENEDNRTNLKNVVNNCTMIENALRKKFMEYRRIPRNKLNAIIIDVLKKTFENEKTSKKEISEIGYMRNREHQINHKDRETVDYLNGEKEEEEKQHEKEREKEFKKQDEEKNDRDAMSKCIEGEADKKGKVKTKGKALSEKKSLLVQGKKDESKKVMDRIKIRKSKKNIREERNAQLRPFKEKEKSERDNLKEGNYTACDHLKDIKKSIEVDINLDNYKGIEHIKKDIFYSIIYPYKYREGNFSTIVNINGISGSGKTTLSHAIAGECNCPFFYMKLPEYLKYISHDSKNNKIKIIFEQIKNEYDKAILCIDDIDVILSSKDDSIDLYLFTYLLSLFDNSNIIILLLSINKPYDSTLYTKIKNFISIPMPTYDDRMEILQFISQKYSLIFDVKYAAALTYGFHRGQLYDIINESMNLCIYNNVQKTYNTCLSQEIVEENEDGKSNEREKYELLLLSNSKETINDVIDDPISSTHSNEKNIFHANGKEMCQNKSKNDYEIKKNDPCTLFYESNKDDKEKKNEINLKRKECTVDGTLYNMKKPKMTYQKIDNVVIYESIKNIKKKMITQNICEVPNINLDNIGSLKKIKKILETKFILPVKYANIYKHLGINKSMGILLYGPPGCGKTMLAKAISNEMKANFIAIKGPEILNKYVGESEKKVREIFSYASTYKPCLIFFDEIDSICINRANNKAALASDRIVNQLLTEMDGLSQRESIYIIATTNRPDIIDKALLRSGRFDQLIYISLPKYQGRIDILKKLSKNMPIHMDVDFSKIARITKGYSGADLYGILRESAFIALQQCRDKIYFLNSNMLVDTVSTQPCNEEHRVHNDKTNESISIKGKNDKNVINTDSSNCMIDFSDEYAKMSNQCRNEITDHMQPQDYTQKGLCKNDTHLSSPLLNSTYMHSYNGIRCESNEIMTDALPQILDSLDRRKNIPCHLVTTEEINKTVDLKKEGEIPKTENIILQNFNPEDRDKKLLNNAEGEKKKKKNYLLSYTTKERKIKNTNYKNSDDNFVLENNGVYKMNNLKNETINEKDKNNLIYEFIQKNKNILTINQSHIMMAVKMVPRSVNKKQMKYYKEISKKFK
ncbi:AAA family ATPase [Plasmodium gonderi]|uniref:AAA family ATPase n=1 Tax=Plasmodium gonderi TaxID=77519 RepID=A0A1Y1JPQ7_PLAGO|nr:AAA family ATPase [Plasmodium gonderi]GAW83455.1 AAA family ATPase [Plasmodium gonderi]